MLMLQQPYQGLPICSLAHHIHTYFYFIFFFPPRATVEKQLHPKKAEERKGSQQLPLCGPWCFSQASEPISAMGKRRGGNAPGRLPGSSCTLCRSRPLPQAGSAGLPTVLQAWQDEGAPAAQP